MTDEKKKPVKTKINFSAEALERLEQSKKHLEESKKSGQPTDFIARRIAWERIHS